MTIYGIIFFVVTSLIFLLWYGGKSKPLSEQEINELIGRLKEQHNEDDESIIIKQLRKLCESDDGKSFYMVNLMKYNTEYNEKLQMTPMDRANARTLFDQHIAKILFKIAAF